jgi:anaerobic magnesium-protoporphyrin IX monomethyl ester cyclase
LDFYRAQCWFCEPVTPIWKERDRYNIKGESFEWEHHTMNSRQACDLIEEIFSSNIQSTWIPQYNFDFDGFWHLTHRGMSIGQTEGFIDVFNSGIKEKMLNPNIKEMSYENLKKLVKTINEEQSFEARKKDASLNTEAEFDF